MLLLYNSIHELLVADLYRWSWGRWRVSESAGFLKGIVFESSIQVFES